jgi:hypothetical protein
MFVCTRNGNYWTGSVTQLPRSGKHGRVRDMQDE